jgi:hypothetical protein
MYELNKRFSIDQDKFQWILAETFYPEKGTPYVRKKYYPTIKALSSSVIDAEAKRALDSLPPKRVKNVSNIEAYDTMLEGIVKRLEVFLENKI